ncbi:hypothetical protein CW362_05350 [Streptomyces populi]|uniref:DUF1772 domain-containing protein n=1 Tax=Streptomyces populi TaxID=2058924 RepID=A0A2I0SVW1_9ACTN|nr:hypothetical protein [Streptomyces populi]PKT74077.1 hypothetical protein CW362_05350 [Streptomyces populi]
MTWPTASHRATAALVLAQTLAVLYTTGFVWTLQLMDYPMVARLREGAAESYMEAHNQTFWRVLAPGLLVAGVTSVLLVVARGPAVPLRAALLSLALLVLIMVLSGAVATPDRTALAQHFSASVHAHLLRVSWVRTVAFTVWSGLDAWLLWRLVR